MIRGRVERNADGGLEPWLSVPIEGANGDLQQFDVIIDTGFTGWLMLPETVINQLGLIGYGNRLVVQSSGESDRFNYYEGRVLWHGRLLPVGVFQSMDQFLLGMELLEGCRVIVDAWEGGDVIIEEVPPELPE